MKFEVLSSDLMSHLSALSRVLASKSPNPILENFLFDIEGNKLTITASDGDTTMIGTVDIQNADGDMKFCVPAKTLIDPLKDLPQQNMSFTIEESGEIIVEYTGGKCNFMTVNSNEYPVRQPMEEGAKQITLNTMSVGSSINYTLFATADDELRPVMNGIFFDIKQDKLISVASDSKKLVRLTNNKEQLGLETSFIMPKKAAVLIKNVIGKEPQELTIRIDSKSFRVNFAGYEISTRMIEGRFPRYEAVIPKGNTNRMIIDRQLFLSVLRRVASFSNQATNQVRLDLEPTQLTLSAQDVDFSKSGKETLACSYEGTPMSIGFRANYLIEILNTLNTQEIELKLGDSSRPGLISPIQDNTDEDILMLIMPMMLTDF